MRKTDWYTLVSTLCSNVACMAGWWVISRPRLLGLVEGTVIRLDFVDWQLAS